MDRKNLYLNSMAMGTLPIEWETTKVGHMAKLDG